MFSKMHRQVHGIGLPARLPFRLPVHSCPLRLSHSLPRTKVLNRSKRGGIVCEVKVEEAFEPKYGMPIVREKVSYGQLLQEIRSRKVKEIRWFSSKKDFYFEGPCLVEYNDGRIKQSVVPAKDMLIPAAMNANQVKGSLLPRVPSDAILNPTTPLADLFSEYLPAAFPFISLILVYIGVQYMNWLKGDMGDRLKLKQREREAAAMQKIEETQETIESEAETLANMGLGVKEIVDELKRSNIKYELYHVKILVDRAQKRIKEEEEAEKKKLEEEAANKLLAKPQETRSKGSPMKEDTSKLLSLQTLKVIKPRRQERDVNDEKALRRKMKQLTRKMRARGMKLQYTDDDRVYFDDVAGVGNAKFEVMEVVDFFVNSERFRTSGARIPRGVLLCGPPGCGKTMLARAVAGEAGVNFLSVNASEFVEMFVGVGASRVRDLFSEARKNAPSIVFIDEIDAVGRVRGAAMGNDERDQTVNQLLSEMDGFNRQDADVVVMAATNRKDVLDPALIRAGRFDRIVSVGLPDIEGRIEILETYLNRVNVEGEMDVREIAFETQRFSGAALANLINTACILAGRAERDYLQRQDIEDALDVDRLGPSRPPYSDGRQRRLAIHEASTALVACLLPSIEPVVHVTIIPREKHPMGQTVLKVNEQRELTQLFTQRYLSEQLLMVLASRAGEEIYYGFDEMSSINQRNIVMARRIVQKLLISDNLEVIPEVGHRLMTTPRQFGRAKKQIIIPWSTTKTHEILDKAMEKRLNDAYEESKSILLRNKPALETLISKLIKQNFLNGDEVREIVDKLGNPQDLQRRAAEKSDFL